MKLSKHAWTIWGILLVVALVLMVLILLSLAVMNRYSDEGEGGLVA